MPDLGTRLLKLEVDGTDFSDAVSTVKIVAGDTSSDFVSFYDAANGGSREYKLSMTMKQNTDATSLWYYMWDQAGQTVPVTIRANGGSAASTTDPQFVGNCVVSEPDGDFLGGDANKSVSARFTTTVEWTYVAKPTLDTTP